MTIFASVNERTGVSVLPISPALLALSVECVILPLSFVDRALAVYERTSSVSLTLFKVSLIKVAVGV